MRLQTAQALAFVLIFAGFAGLPIASGADGSWQSFTDGTYGLRVAIPKSWHTVPTSVAGVQAAIAQAQRQNNAGLAIVYSTFIGTPAARKQMLGYHFQAFQYLPHASIQPDFALSFARTTPAIAKNLQGVDDTFAHSYAAKPGTIVTRHAVVKLPAGPAALIEGTQTVSGINTQYQIYILSHDNLLYEFSFRADARATGEAATFAAIMQHFAYT